ncbi:MAG: right-handed parallel beta-helix repeat-containing protein [Deltaproteobacteria bacterium]|nr:right-handed parallel beta-helix repeat-containing protein [Deltaproteobacteria bacterium]
MGPARTGAVVLCALVTPACSPEETQETHAAPPGGCVIGETTLEDGSCRPAGVPSDGCAEGFASDEVSGCVPILPAELCADGLMAVPGDTACREIAPCGDGPWGDIPTDGSTTHVDGSYAGGSSDGSAAHPYTTIQAGLDSSQPGAIVAVAAGQYDEALELDHHVVQLWGRCPAMVTVNAPPTEFAVSALQPSSGSTIRGLAITGGRVGFATSGATALTVEQLWVHDVGGPGIDAEGTLGETQADFRDILVERTEGYGVFIMNATASLERMELRYGRARPDGTLGSGMFIQNDPATGGRSSGTVRHLNVHDNLDVGIAVAGSDAVIEATSIRDTLPRELDGMIARGIDVYDHVPTGQRSNVTIAGVVVERSHSTGVMVFGSDVVIENTVVRDTFPRPDASLGRGVAMEPNPTGATASSLTIRRSLLERNHDISFFASFGNVVVEETRIRDTYPRPDGLYGRGLEVRDDPAGVAALWMARSVVERSVDVGISIGANASVDSTFVTATAPRPVDNAFGDGLVVIWGFGAVPPTVDVTGSLLAHNSRAGLANFDANATLANNHLECNVIQLNAEDFYGPTTMADLGGNVCGCEGATAECQVLSTGLEPPQPVDSSER